ncbi:hypothetical protein D1872_288070 [compost metagenome]
MGAHIFGIENTVTILVRRHSRLDMKRHCHPKDERKFIIFIVTAGIDHLKRPKLRHQTEVLVDGILHACSAL